MKHFCSCKNISKNTSLAISYWRTIRESIPYKLKYSLNWIIQLKLNFILCLIISICDIYIIIKRTVTEILMAWKVNYQLFWPLNASCSITATSKNVFLWHLEEFPLTNLCFISTILCFQKKNWTFPPIGGSRTGICSIWLK